MKKTTFIKSTLLSAVLSSAVGLNAQSLAFPSYTNATPEWAPQIFRGNAIWGDYNNDGKLDAIAVGRNVPESGLWNTYITIFKSNGADFDEVQTDIVISGVYNAVFAWIDYNNDGNLDLLYTGTTNDEKSDKSSDVFAKLYKNTGAPDYRFEEVDFNFEGVYVEQEGSYASVFAVNDFNKDGYPDFAVIGKRDNRRFVQIYKNENGTGNFTLLNNNVEDGTENFNEISSGSVAWGDYDGDGWADLLAIGWHESSNVSINLYKNLDGRNFKKIYVDVKNEGIADGVHKGQAAWLDYDGDGLLDFIVTGEYATPKGTNFTWSKKTDLYRNTGIEENPDYPERRFVKVENTNLTALKNSSVDFADLNNDGLLDIVVAGEGNGAADLTMIALNKGDNSFEIDDTVLEGFRSGTVIQLGDYDRDGALDFMGMGYAKEKPNSRFRIFHNDGNTKNTAPEAPENLKISAENGMTTFTWDAGHDQETKVTALRYNLYIKKINGEVMMLVPADPATGHLKIAELSAAISLRSYTINLDQSEIAEWGVQTIDQGKMGSLFAINNGNAVSFVKDDEAIRTYGNKGRIHVESESPVMITVYDIKGNKLTSELTSGKGVIGRIFANGVYVVKAQTAGKCHSVKVVL